MKIVAMIDFGNFRLVVKCHKRKRNPFEVCFRIKGNSGWIDTTMEEYANMESCLYYIQDYIDHTEDAQQAVKAESYEALFEGKDNYR